jgi:polyisoprenoid-binding protein YceI
MKQTLLIGLTAIFFATSCSNNTNQVEATDEQEVVTANESSLTLNIDTEASTVKWVGSKVLGNSHNGTVNISGGEVAIEGGMIIAGNFTIDMNSITNNDLPVDGDYNQARLVGHLKSNDFFNVEEYPTSSFEITSVTASSDDAGNTHVIAGNLIIRGISKNITFPANVSVTESGLSAKAKFAFNRLDWGVNWDKEKVDGFMDKVVSQAKDDFVKNAIELEINLVAKQ